MNDAGGGTCTYKVISPFNAMVGVIILSSCGQTGSVHALFPSPTQMGITTGLDASGVQPFPGALLGGH